MKRLAFMVAGLCLCGVALAEGTAPTTSVEGSNTGVVIKKTQVKSATSDYQLLVVPVKGHNIAEGDDTTTSVTLGAMFPAASNVGKIVIVISGDAQGSYEVVASGDGFTWQKDGSSDDAGTTQLPAGTIFWYGNNVNTVTLNDASDPIVFCGNANTTGVNWSAAVGQMTPLGNSTSDAIQVSAISANPGAQLFRIKAESTDYELYRYRKPLGATDYGWYKLVDGVFETVSDTDIIPAAEAFYYYNP